MDLANELRQHAIPAATSRETLQGLAPTADDCRSLAYIAQILSKQIRQSTTRHNMHPHDVLDLSPSISYNSAIPWFITRAT
jgi:hypothetical protein